MRHFKAIGIKYIVISIVLLSLFGIFRDTSIWEILFMSLLVTGVAYFIGDLFVLPRMGNAVATIGDFGLAFFTIWALSSLMMNNTSPIITSSLAAAGLIAASEALFHVYMQKKILEEDEQKQKHQPLRPNYQTEYAEEYEVETKDLKKK